MNTFSNNIKPHAGKEEVLCSAECLLKAFGETTTLEVKVDLRERGFIAFQSDVSYWMAQLAQEEGWGFRCNGRNRTYFASEQMDWWTALLQVCPN